MSASVQAPPILIRNAQCINADGRFCADLFCEAGRIAEIGTGLVGGNGIEEWNASGRIVFPGFIDPHVHIHLPFMGTHAKESWESGSRAALLGGTTTLIEMCCPSRDEDPLAAIRLWKEKAAGVASCDYTFHMGVTRFDAGTEAQLRRIVEEEKITSFKVFLAYKGAFGIDDAELFQTLSLAAGLGVVVTAHCENAELVARLQEQLVAAGCHGPEWHEPSRPVEVEVEGCHHLATFARLTGARIYVVHTSNREAIRCLLAAREAGVDVAIEVVIPHLVLDKSFAEQPGFEGAKYVMSPPLRAREQQDFLWEALSRREVDAVGTDHAPFDFATQKHMGHPDPARCLDAGFRPAGRPGDFTRIPNGIPSLEERVKLLHTHGVVTGRLTLEDFVRVASTRAAEIFGLAPRKGRIAEGADADLVLWDPEWRGILSAATHAMAVDYSAFEGWPVVGRADTVFVRGRAMVCDGAWCGEKGWGTFLERTPDQ